VIKIHPADQQNNLTKPYLRGKIGEIGRWIFWGTKIRFNPADPIVKIHQNETLSNKTSENSPKIGENIALAEAVACSVAIEPINGAKHREN